MRKVLAALLALAASSVFAQETIKIGVITDKVGPAKPYSEPTLEGIVFGASEINAKGGVLGRRLELLIEDDQGRPDISATMARKLVDAGAVFILSITLTPSGGSAISGSLPGNPGAATFQTESLPVDAAATG